MNLVLILRVSGHAMMSCKLSTGEWINRTWSGYLHIGHSTARPSSASWPHQRHLHQQHSPLENSLLYCIKCHSLDELRTAPADHGTQEARGTQSPNALPILNVSWTFDSPIILVFTQCNQFHSKGNSFSGGAEYTWMGNFAIFDWNHRLSRKRHEIGLWLPWNVNRKS